MGPPISERSKAIQQNRQEASREKQVLELAIRFINLPPEKINQAFLDALNLVGSLTGSDRCYLDRYDLERETTTNLFEWCAAGIHSEHDNQQSVPLSRFPEMFAAHQRGEPMIVSCTRKLPAHTSFRQYLESQQIQSMVSLPMMNEQECLGFIGFDSVRQSRTWTGEEIDLLRVLAELFTNAELRRRHDEMLAEEQKKLNDLIESMPDTMIYCKNLAGRFTRINQAQARLLGVEKPEQALGQSDRDFFTEEHALWAEADEAQVMRTGQPLLGKIEKIRFSDDCERWVSTTKIPTYDRQGNVIGTMGITRDINDLKLAEEALRLQESQLRSIIDNQPGPVVLKDTAGRFLVVNSAFCHSFGITHPAEAIGKTDFDFFPPDMAQKFQLDDRKVLETGQSLITEEVVLDRGERKIFETFKSPVRGPSGTIIGVTVFTWDISQRKATEKALREAEAMYRGIFENAPVAIFQSTPEGRFTTVNPEYARIAGYESPEEMIAAITDIAAEMYHHPQVREEYKRLLANQGKVEHFEAQLKKKDGTLFWVSMNTVVHRNGEGKVISYDGFLTDITHQKKSAEHIWFLSFHDHLTKLYNRSFFEEEAHRLGESRELPLAILMADVNGLKLVNDTFGHDQGDQLLIRFAQALKQSCRKEDLIARWGGDEFIILFPRSDARAVEEVAERLLSTCREISTNQFPLSVSMGFAVKEDFTTPIDQVIQEAEERMHRNKLSEDRSARHIIITSLERTLRETTRETEAHAHRLRRIARALGTALALPESDLNDLDLLARLHDLGKIAIPQAILNKPGPLTPQEWETIKNHPEIGSRIAQSSPDLKPIAEAILAHHERWDGTGYPRQLKNEGIPLSARIIAIADAFDVMIQGRPYRQRISMEAARQEIQRSSHTQFDPHLVKLFLSLKNSL